jgi:hypothetical protein
MKFGDKGERCASSEYWLAPLRPAIFRGQLSSLSNLSVGVLYSCDRKNIPLHSENSVSPEQNIHLQSDRSDLPPTCNASFCMTMSIKTTVQ